MWPHQADVAVFLVPNQEEGVEYDPADEETHVGGIGETGTLLRGGCGMLPTKPRCMGPPLGWSVDPAPFGAPWRENFHDCRPRGLEGAPTLTRRIVESCDEVVCHGHEWACQHRIDEAVQRDLIRRAAEGIERTWGRRPQG